MTAQPTTEKKGADTVLNVRMSATLKQKTTETAARYGLTSSELIRSLLVAEMLSWETPEFREKRLREIEEFNEQV